MADAEQKIVTTFTKAQDRLVLQAADLSLETIAAMVDSTSIDVAPTYQRRERWGAQAQAALIESFLLNIPVPPVYLAEDEYGKYSVIDGKQRITAIRAFMRNQLTLTELDTFKELEGLTYKELPPPLANALQVRPYLRAVTLLKQSDPKLKYEVFTRLNTGGEPLNAQEIRNVAFRGPLNDLIFSLAEDKFLRQQLKITGTKSPNFREMADAEFVLRFLTLRKSWQQFSGDLRRAMDSFMEEHRRGSKKTLGDFRDAFRFAIKGCKRLWGDAAFRRPVDSGWRDQTLSGMYDAQMLAVAQLSGSEVGILANRHTSVHSHTRRLFDDSVFEAAVRQATNTPSRLSYRVEVLRDTLKKVAA